MSLFGNEDFLNIYVYFNSFIYVSMCEYWPISTGAQAVQKRASDSLEMELQAAVNLVWVREPKHKFPDGAV